MERILIIEENTMLSEQLAEALRRAGFTCSQAFSGTEAVFYAAHDPFALVILDPALSEPGAESVCSRIQRITPIPILFFPNNTGPENKTGNIQSLPVQLAGNPPYASDAAHSKDAPQAPYLSDLLARVRIQLRDCLETPAAKAHGAHCIQYHGLSLYPSSYLAVIDGHELSLTKQEFKILHLLLSMPRHTFSKQELYDYAWDDFYRGHIKTINVHISNIRRKLRVFSDFQFIETVWKRGYRRGGGVTIPPSDTRD